MAGKGGRKGGGGKGGNGGGKGGGPKTGGPRGGLGTVPVTPGQAQSGFQTAGPKPPSWWPSQFPWNPPSWQNAGPGTAPPKPPDPWGSEQESAFAALATLLREYGLSSLEGFVRQMILGGTTDAATIMLQLQQTNEWKQRFAGNEMLRANGLGVLSPGEYLALERSYAQIMKNYGLPAGFYDDPSDFAKWIGNNVSAAELQQRVSAYADLANREDPAIVAQLQSMGMNKGDLLAYMMDPGRAAPLIQRQYQTALLGGAARRAGMAGSDLSNAYLGQLADQGVSEQQASQGYGAIAGSLKDARSLSAIYGQDYGLQDMQAEVFQNDGNASKKRKRLASQERATFSGSAGVGRLGSDGAGSY